MVLYCKKTAFFKNLAQRIIFEEYSLFFIRIQYSLHQYIFIQSRELYCKKTAFFKNLVQRIIFEEYSLFFIRIQYSLHQFIFIQSTELYCNNQLLIARV